MQSFSRRSRQQANDSRLKVVTWLVILVLIALSVAWWWQSTSRRSAGDEALAATEMSATGSTPAETCYHAARCDQHSSGRRCCHRPGRHGRGCPCGGLRCDGYPGACFCGCCPDRCQCGCWHCDRCCSIRANGTESEEAVVDPATAPQLKMSFTADCWLDVKDANGKTLFSGLKKANDELVLEGAEPLKFIIGAPMAVKLDYKGQSFDMSRYNNGRTARFSLPQE